MKLLEIRLTAPVRSPEVRAYLFPSRRKDHYWVTSRTAKLLKDRKIEFTVVRKRDSAPLEKRIIYPLKSFLYSTPEAETLQEVCAKLASSARRNGTLPHVLFMGRDPRLEKGNFFLDKIGGRRLYQWRLSYRKTPQRSLAASFPKLLRRINNPNTKFVLSFGAGGLRFLAHPSVMKFLDAIGAREQVDEVWGCSGGALMALGYAKGVPPDFMEEMGYNFYNKRFQLSFKPSVLRVLKNLFLDAFLPASPSQLKGFISAQHVLQELIRLGGRNKKLQIPFYCLAYNVDRQKNQVLTPLPIPKVYGKDWMVRVNPIDGVVASSSIPILYVPKQIRSGKGPEHYVDGATIEEVPMASLYRKWLLDRKSGREKRRKLVILAVDLFPRVGQRWLNLPIIRKLPLVDFFHFGLSLVDMVRQARIHEQSEPLRRDPNVTVMTVTLPLQSLSVLNTSHIPKIIQTAQTSFLDQLMELEKRL